MIVPMKKAAIIVQSKDMPWAIKRLRQAGILHLEHHQAPQGKEIEDSKDDISFLAQAIMILAHLRPSYQRNAGEVKKIDDWRLAIRQVINGHKRLAQLKEYSLSLEEKIEEWQGWGDFDPQEIDDLAQKNIYLRLYKIPKKEIMKLKKTMAIKQISEKSGFVNCVVISEGNPDTGLVAVALPKMPLRHMRVRLSENIEAIKGIEQELGCYALQEEEFSAIKKGLEEALEFQEALKGAGESGELTYISGYIPFDSVKVLKETAKKEQWALSITQPKEEDSVPTLIRNPRWISFISPIFKILEILPGYRELDISLWFLIFFSIFFGILIGDIGYGLVYIVLTFFLQRKFSKKFKDTSVFILLYILSGTAIVWGLLTASFFGQEWVSKVLAPMAPALKNDKGMQAFCFFLGALHLSIAHLWRGSIKFPSRTALSDLGWIMILWGSFFLAKALVLGDAFPIIGKWFFITGAVLVIGFSSSAKNIFKAGAEGLKTFLLSAVNTFTDVVSYIRLFAVGLASVAVADAFNTMAASVGFHSIVSGFLASLILFSGHCLNIMLGPLSILVHGVRLNVLEFSGHADIKWSGFAYKPFKDR